MKNKLFAVVSLVFLGYVIWWATFQQAVEKQGLSVQWFGGTYGVVALVGSLLGFRAAQLWGGFKTVLGRALMLFSFGLLAQEAGQLIYTYYVYGAKIDIPYPSWGDVAYFGSVLLYIGAALLLSKVSGLKFSLKDKKYRVLVVLVPAILLAVSYWVLLHNHEYDFHKPATAFLDFGYPMGQAIYISIALTAYLLSRKQLGGVMKRGILMVILALCIQYVADFTFVFQNSRGTFVPGKYDDLLYLTSYFAMAAAMIHFIRIHQMLRRNVQSASKPPTAEVTTEKEA